MILFLKLFLNFLLFIQLESKSTILSSEILRVAKKNKNDTISLCMIYYFEKNRIIDLNEYSKIDEIGICNSHNTTYYIDNDNITFKNQTNQSYSIICGIKSDEKYVINLCGYQLIYLHFIASYSHFFGNFNIVTGFIINFFQLRYQNSSLWFSIINSLLFLTEELFNTFTTQKEYEINSFFIYFIIIGIFIISLLIFKFIHYKDNIICGLYVCFFSYTLFKIIYYFLIINSFLILKQLYILITIIPFFIIGIMIGNKDNKLNIAIITTPFLGAYILIKGIDYLLGGLTNEILLNKFYKYNKTSNEKPLYISIESINTYIILYFVMSFIGFQHQYRTGKELIEFPDNTIINDEFLDYGVEANKDNVFEMSKSIIEDNNTSSVNNESIATNRASIQGDI